MSATDVDIEFIFSKGNGLAESFSKQLRYGGNYVDFAKTIINLDKVINSAVLIEKHVDKYRGTSRANRNLEAVFVMVSAFRDGDYVIPVQLEIKKASDVGGRLYLTVAMTKIEASVLGGTIDNNQAFPLIPASTHKLADIFKEINPKDGHFLKYLPDNFLSNAQKDAKKRAIEEDSARISTYKLPTNAKTDRQALVDMFEQMVTNSNEYKVLQEYKKHINEMLSLEEKLERLSEEIKRVSLAEGPRDMEYLKNLKLQQAQTMNRLNYYDNKLLSLEKSGVLKAMIERNRKQAAQKSYDKAKEYYRQKSEARETIHQCIMQCIRTR